MINALLIDDEEHNRSALRLLLARHCPAVSIAGEADSVDAARIELEKLRPNLIFLDVQMPVKNGFDLLKQLPDINFEVIFVTAHDNYAINAFEFNAIGYLLKPVNPDKLVLAVENAGKRISANPQNETMLHFVRTFSDQDALISKFPVHHNGKVIFLNISEVSCIESHLNMTTIKLANGDQYHSSKELHEFEKLLKPLPDFVRINKSVMLNLVFIKSYTKGDPCIIEMASGLFYEVSRRRKSEILKRLKAS